LFVRGSKCDGAKVRDAVALALAARGELESCERAVPVSVSAGDGRFVDGGERGCSGVSAVGEVGRRTVGAVKRGPNYERNQASRHRRKQQKMDRKVLAEAKLKFRACPEVVGFAESVVQGKDETVVPVVLGGEVVLDGSVVQGRCETVVTQASVGPVVPPLPVAVPEGLQAEASAEIVPVWRRNRGGSPGFVHQRGLKGVSVAKVVDASDSLRDAEKLARESLAKRRAAENAVAVRMAELKLRSLNDEKKCQDYEDLKRQRVIQWQNQALAKSQSSAKSLDPGSSVSMREFREQAKLCADLEYKHRKTIRAVHELYGGAAAMKVLDIVDAPGASTLMDQEAQECYADGVPEQWGFDVDAVPVC